MKATIPVRLAFAAVAAAAVGAGMMAMSDDSQARPWQDMLQHDNAPYSGNYRHDSVIRPAGHTLAVQIESSRSIASGLLLRAGSDPQAILTDHVGAAAAIMDETADRMSGRDVRVVALNRPQALSEWFWDGRKPQVQALLGHADVLSLSMGGRYAGDQSTSCGDGSIGNPGDAAAADALWRRSHTVMVQSVGNEGGDGGDGVQRDNPNMTMRSDTFLYIGEADRDSRAGVYIVQHSSRGGPSVVVTNPFRQGFFYRYYGTRTADELRRRLENFFSSRDPETGRLNRDIFAERLALPAYGDDEDAYKLETKPGQTATCRVLDQSRRPDLTNVHPVFSSVSFPGKENLTKPPEWQAAHADEVLQAFINGLVAAQEFYQTGQYGKTDAQGFVSGLWGTSYAAPHAGGMIAAMREKYPRLSEYDLNAAALLAAVPVDKVETDKLDAEGGTVYRAIAYRNNGRGLMHNDYEAGFGFLDEDAYAAMVARMAALRGKNHALATREDSALSAVTTFAQKGGAEYRLRVDRDIVALRANLMLKFAGGNAGVPVSITLVNPAGGAIEIAPSKPLTGGPQYSFASTDGHFGNHTKGVWTIRVPAGVTLEQAQLTIPGVAKGGLIDRMLDEVAGPARDLAALPAASPVLTLALK